MTVTRERAFEMLDAALEKHGADTIYMRRDQEWYSEQEVCRYINERNEPMCLIGVVLIENNLASVADLESMNSRAFSEVQDDLMLDLDSEAVTAFVIAQAQQDGGVSWGQAVAIAKQSV